MLAWKTNENLGITAYNIDIFTMVILDKKDYLHKSSTSPNLDFLRLNEKFDKFCLIYAVFKVSPDYENKVLSQAA